MNVQVITDPAGRLLWASPALPGAVHDIKAARTHGIIDALSQEAVVFPYLIADFPLVRRGVVGSVADRTRGVVLVVEVRDAVGGRFAGGAGTGRPAAG
jgi:hypothetical protein